MTSPAMPPQEPISDALTPIMRRRVGAVNGRYFVTAAMIFESTQGELLVAAAIGREVFVSGNFVSEDFDLAKIADVSVSTVRASIKKLTSHGHIDSAEVRDGKRTIVISEHWKKWLKDPLANTKRRDAENQRKWDKAIV